MEDFSFLNIQPLLYQFLGNVKLKLDGPKYFWFDEFLSVYKINFHGDFLLLYLDILYEQFIDLCLLRCCG